jgi:single-strand selective monofunctional uracil DNA glycosylase
MSPLQIATARVVAALEGLRFPTPVDVVYDPLVHARRAHQAWLTRYGSGRKEVVLVGMNPGPFGMVQTGVPFGEVAAVRDWLGIEEPIERPEQEHAKRRIEGFACRRSEVSGRRFWGFVRARFGTPARFFARFWVHNYCPLAFVEASGRNLTPDKLPREATTPLFAACDRYLADVVRATGASLVVGVGAFAEDRARRALATLPLRFGRIPHPSPASPAANRGWDAAAASAFLELGVALDG